MKFPRTESLIIFAFLGCVLLWGISKCSERRSDDVRRVRDISDDNQEDRPLHKDSVAMPKPQVQQTPQPQQQIQQQPAPQPVMPAPTQYSTTQQSPGAAPPRTQVAPVQNNAAKPATQAAPSGATLYVTIDGLKVHKEPALKSETVEQLKLYEAVVFLNQKTEWTQEINLGLEKVTDHWVKIRTSSGKTGWVFGAGLHYYKMKREGVLEDSKPVVTPKKKG